MNSWTRQQHQCNSIVPLIIVHRRPPGFTRRTHAYIDTKTHTCCDVTRCGCYSNMPVCLSIDVTSHDQVIFSSDEQVRCRKARSPLHLILDRTTFMLVYQRAYSSCSCSLLACHQVGWLHCTEALKWWVSGPLFDTDISIASDIRFFSAQRHSGDFSSVWHQIRDCTPDYIQL